MAEIVSIQFRSDSDTADRDIRQLVAAMERLGAQTRRTSTATTTQGRAERQRSRELDRSSRSTKRAETSTRRYDRAQRGLNTRLSSAAKYAAGAAAAYIGIGGIRNAIDSTTDLTKATLALNKNLGLSAKTASAFGAQAIARGADVSQLNMVFNTLAGRVRSARNGSEATIKTFKNLGISLKDLRTEKPDKLLFDITDGLEGLGGGFARAGIQRELFGRGAAKLAPLLRDGSDALKAQLADARELGATFSTLGLKNMEDFLVSERRFELAQLGLKISLTQALRPAIEGVTEELTNMGKVLNDPKLSADEKLDLIADRFADLLTRMVGEATERSPKIAGAFVKGFLSAPIWTQFIAGGLLLAKFGALPTILGKQGGKAGGAFGRNFALGMTAALLTVELGKQIKTIIEGHDLQQTGRESFSKYLGDLGVDVKSFVGRNKVAVATQFGELIFNAQTKKVVAAKGKQLQSLVGKTAEDAAIKLDAMATAPTARRDLESLAKLADSKMGRIAGVTKKDLAIVRDALKKNPEQGRVALARTYDQIVAKIRNAMEKGRISTRDGMAKIEQLTQEKLALYGVGSIGEAVKSSGTKGPLSGGKNGGGGGGGGSGSWSKNQTGGVIVPGQGSGDKVRALLEPGEVVWNKKAVAAMGGPKIVDSVNKTIPRFARGGGVDMPRWGSNYPVGMVSAGAVNLVASAAEALLRRSRSAGPANGPAGKHRSYPWLSGDTDFLPRLGMALSRMARSVGSRISVQSGWRSYAEQAALFERFGSPRAAPPGRSNHEDGRAADISPGKEVFGATARRFGLTFPMSWEPWHIELMRHGGVVPSRPLKGSRWITAGKDNRWNEDESYTLMRQLGIPRAVAKALSAKVMGESSGIAGNVGHDAGGTQGLGLLQITTGYNDHIISKWGGRSAMFDPKKNFLAAWDVWRERARSGMSPIGGWYAPNSRPGRFLEGRVGGKGVAPKKKQPKRKGRKGGKTGSTVEGLLDTDFTDVLKEQWSVVAENARRGRAAAGVWNGFSAGRRLGTYQGGTPMLISNPPGSASDPMNVQAPPFVVLAGDFALADRVTSMVVSGQSSKRIKMKWGREARRRAMGPGRG